ncbi:MAG: hypothetical protein Kow0089_08900 [Desulfobulbaceae bacterium]
MPDTARRVLRYGGDLGSLVEQHDALPRCMDRLREMIAEAQQKGTSLPNGTIVTSRRLQAGCGRFDREWFAPEGGVWLAVAWADILLPEFSRLLPLAAGTAVCEAVNRFGVDARVKWVNDILARGRKIAGVLCETTTAEDPGERYHLIGIGVNCNNSTFPEELRSSATSMRLELGGDIDLGAFSIELLACLAWNFGLIHFYEEQSLAGQDGRSEKRNNPVVEAWKRVSDTPGRAVMYGFDVMRAPMYRAVARDIDQEGALVMELENGMLVREYSGEIIYLSD